jgi:uncharacterized protein YndB with AHSA1/START domain
MRDHVEREILIDGPIERAFAALTDATTWPTWGPQRLEGRLAPGDVPVLDFGPSGGGRVAVYVVALDAPTYFAYRWAQGVTDPELLVRDPRQGPSTLVEFHLEAVDGRTRVRVVESGISKLPGMAETPDSAVEGMEAGWGLMLGGLARGVASAGQPPSDRIEHAIEVAVSPDRAFEALVHPERWWCERIDGAIAAGTQPLLDFGMFGRIRFDVIAVDSPASLVYRWLQGVADRTADPRGGPSTTVELRVEAAGAGARVRAVETGFLALPGDPLPLVRGAQQAWAVILGLLQRHLGA